MINTNLPSLFTLRNIQKPRAWMIKHGINANSADRLLRNEQRHLKFDDVEKLCLGLNCSPSDLFIWQPDSEADDIPNHPLQAIRSNKTLPDVMEQLNHSTIDELKIIADFMARLKEERGR
ncbi:MAG: helix-turn-helix domain-containing protein [Bacteroidia bacterium]